MATKHVNNFNSSRTFKDISNTHKNFKFMETMIFEIAGTKRLGRGRGQ